MSHQPSASQIVRLAVVFETGLGLVAFALGGLFSPRFTLLEQPLWDQLVCRPRDLAWGAGASIPMLAALGLMVRYPLGPLGRLLEFTRSIVAPMFGECSGIQLALISLSAGVGEELLFRGLAQQALVERWGPAPGVLIASLAFGLLHALTATYALLAAVVGAWLGVVYLATGNLVAPAVAHALYDFAALWLLIRRSAGGGWRPPPPDVNRSDA